MIERGNYYFVAITGIASVLTGTINYLYHPIMIRYLDGSDFAMFQSVMSLFNIFSVIGAGLSLYVTQQVSIHVDNSGYLSYIKSFGLRFATRRGIGLFLLFSLLSPAIALYLHLPSPLLVILVAISYLVAGYSIVYGALLQGSHKFEYMAGIMIWGSVCRIGFGSAAIYLDLGIEGAIAAVSIGSLLSVLMQYIFARNIGTSSGDVVTCIQPSKDPVYNHLHTILFFVGVSFLTMLLTQIDILIVQHKFFGQQAGNYVAVSILAKFVFFLAGAIETVYFPQLAKNKANNVSLIQVRNYFILLFLLVLCSIAGASVLGEYVLYLFKPHLVNYIDWLEPLLIASSCLFFFTTIFKLLVSRQEFKSAYGLIALGIGAMFRLHIAPSTLGSFIGIYTQTMISLCIGASILFFSTLRHKNHVRTL